MGAEISAPFFMNKIENKNYLSSLDGMRGFFCLCILFCHFHFTYLKLPYIVGYLLLHSFFVMSSYLITVNLLYAKNKHDSFKKFFIEFYTKRVLRIFPTYFLYFFIILFIGIITAHSPLKQKLGITYEIKYFGWMVVSFTYNFKDFWAWFQGLNYKASYAFPHLWSISFEEQFYLIIPFLIFMFSKKWLIRISIFMMIAFAIIRIIGVDYMLSIINDPYLPSFIFIKSTFFQFDTFFYGVLLAVLNPDLKKRDIRIFYVLLIVFVFSCLGNAYYLTLYNKKSIVDNLYSYIFPVEGFHRYYYHVLINMICFYLVFIAVKKQSYFKLFTIPFFISVGKYTYGVYVYQYLFIFPIAFYLVPYLKSLLGYDLIVEILATCLIIFLLLRFSNFIYTKYELYCINKKDLILQKLKIK